jgi:hypothetical protein
MARRNFLASALALPWLPAALRAAEPERPPQAIDAVLRALRELMDAVRSEDLFAFQTLLDDTATGVLKVRQQFAQLVAAEGQMHLHFSEIHVVVQDDLAEIRARWERRSVARGPQHPQLRTGHVVLQFGRPQKTGWRLRAVNGDNPFAPSR